LRAGRADGGPLAARTVGHAHRVLHRALSRAVSLEIVRRNVAHAVPPPRVEVAEVAILCPEQITEVLERLEGHSLRPIVVLALGTGMRRGELCALRWADIDLEIATVRVARSLEETASRLRFETPKTRAGRRTISIPPYVVAALQAHRRQQTRDLWPVSALPSWSFPLPTVPRTRRTS
jgi:integrase